jgi:hypothetical protein
MPIRSIADLRRWAGEAGTGASDEDLVLSYSEQVKLDPAQVAHQLGMYASDAGMNRQRGSASVDNYQSNLYGVGEAVTDRMGLAGASAWLGQQRRANTLEADVASSRARSMGAVDSWKDVHGAGDFGDYAVGLGIQSLPYMAEAVVGGGIGSMATRGVASAAVRNVARTGAAVAASYPSSVGDVLSSQRDQAGQTDLGSAAAYGLPYAAANAFGVEGALARQSLARNGIRALDNLRGVRGGLVRAGVTGAGTGLQEAGSETFQEGMNQAGRMAVDPSETFYNEKSAERFGESAVGGGVLGAAFGGGAGGWRRSQGYQPRTVDEGATDLLAPSKPLGLSYEGTRGVGRMIVFPDGSTAMEGDQELDARYPNRAGASIVPIDLTGPGFAEYQPRPAGPAPDIEAPNWDTAPGAAAPRGGLPYSVDPATGNLTLRAPTEAGTADLFGGEPRLPAQPEMQRPEFDLAPDSGQQELPLENRQPIVAFEPPVPKGNQRGVPGQLPFSANTTSPKGQILQGMADSLAAENHLDEGSHTQASTLISQGKFAAAKKLIDEAGKNKEAADALVLQAREQEITQAAAAARQAQADEVYEQAKAAQQKYMATMQKNGRVPREGTKKRAEHDAAFAEHQRLVQVWADLTKKPKAADGANPTAAPAQRPGSPAGGGGVQPGGSPADSAGVRPEPAAAPALPPAPGGEQAAAPVLAVPKPPRSLTGNPLEAVTSEALIQVVEDAKEIDEHQSAMDELYRRWRDDGDETAYKYFEDNKTVPGFASDYQRTRERAGDAPTPAAEGKMGLKLGRSQAGTQSLVSSETDEVLRGLGSIKLALAANPDNAASEPQIPAGVTFDDGKTAAAWLEANAKSWFVRLLMKRITPYLDGVQVHLLKPGDEVPKDVADHLNGTARGATARTRSSPDIPSVYVRGYDGNTEIVWAHELLHAATMVRTADPALRAPLKALATKVRATLLKATADFDSNAESYYFFQSMFRDTDEFLAYSLTSPTFQSIMEKLDENGNWLQAAEPEALRAVPKLTLRQKFVDMVRGWFNLPKGYTNALEEVLKVNAEIADRNANPPAQKNLRDEINRLLDALLRSPAPAGIGSQALTESTGDRGVPADTGGAVEPEVKASSTHAETPLGQAFGKSPAAQSTLGQKVQDGLYNLQQSPWALKWTTNDQIAEGYKHLKPVQDINRATGRMAAVANRYLETASQTAKKWRALPDQVQLQMQQVMLRSTMAESHVAIKVDGRYLEADEAYNHPLNKHLEKTPETRVEFGRLYQQWNAMPASAKAVYDTVRDDLTRQHEDTLDALRKTVVDQYAGQLKRALTSAEVTALAHEPAATKKTFRALLGETASAAEIRALEHLYQALRDVTADFGTVKGPYFPLVRFGDHVVVMKAPSLTTLEGNAQVLRDELQQAMEDAPPAAAPEAEGHDAKVSDLRTRYNKALAAVAEAKKDDKKYVVEFHESPAQAQRALQELQAKHPGADVYRSVKEDYYRGLDGASPAFLKNLTETLTAALDTGEGVTAEAKATALQSVKDMYMRRQPERSALRAELKRMTIEGVQAGQMLRGYAQSSRNGAWRISRLLHAGDVTSGLAALSENRRDPHAKQVLNEMKSRFVGDIAPPAENKWLQRLSGATYFMHLGFNISYFTTNATQAWLISLPVMSGRHGLVNASNSLMAASKDVIKLLSQATARSVEENGVVVGLQLRLTDEQIASLAKDPGEARMLKSLTDDGVIDITIKHDLGAISDGTTKSIPGKILELSGALANYPELYNRLATSLAAYRMESARQEGGGESAEQAQVRAEKYAEYIVNRTHFNYSPENAPRMMRGQLGRLVFQFKRYQQGMIYLFAKLAKDAWRGDADAAKSLAYLLGGTLAVSGVSGLPIAAPVALAVKLAAALFPDDDEPEWMQQWYNGMKDAVGEDLAQALAKGLPTLGGLDVSAKVGQGNLLNPVAYANTAGKKVFSRDYMTEVGFSLMGPGASMLGNEAEAVGYAKNGEFLKAAEKGLPTFAANGVKAFRRAADGLTTRQGDTIMEPQEFNALSIGAKALGFESVKVSDMYQDRSSFMGAVRSRTEARQALLRSYYEAVKSGDAGDRAAARQAIDEFNQRQPADRVKGKDLEASIKQHAQRAKETVGGLRVGKRDQDTYRRLHGED